MEKCSTGKSFNLSTTLDQNPFFGSILPDGKPKQPDQIPFSKEIIFDPVIGRQIFIQGKVFDLPNFVNSSKILKLE